jgi:hypothetical protein
MDIPIHAIKLTTASPANIQETTLEGSIIWPPSIDMDIAQKDRDRGNKKREIENRIEVMPHLASGEVEVGSDFGSSRMILLIDLLLCIITLLALLLEG